MPHGNSKTKKSSLRVASYNIRKAVGLDWRRDARRILDVLSEIDADVIALQEADKRFGAKHGTLPVDDLFDRLGYQFVNFTQDEPSHGWHGNAILYRAPLTPLKSETIAIPTLEPRGAVGSLFSDTHTKFSFIGTHLSLLGTMRAKQVRFLSDRIIKGSDPQPTIIAGDFNEWRESGKAHRAAGQEFRVITPGPSFHASRPTVPLDRFVLRGNIEVQNVCVHATPLAKRASDHLPIYMDVAIPAKG